MREDFPIDKADTMVTVVVLAWWCQQWCQRKPHLRTFFSVYAPNGKTSHQVLSLRFNVLALLGAFGVCADVRVSFLLCCSCFCCKETVRTVGLLQTRLVYYLLAGCLDNNVFDTLNSLCGAQDCLWLVSTSQWHSFIGCFFFDIAY